MSNRIIEHAEQLQKTKATGARVGVQKHTAPIPKRKYTASDKTQAQKDRKAKRMREYRAGLTTEQKDKAKDQRRERAQHQLKGKPYTYLPSIAQARDRRSRGDRILEHYNFITSRMMISDSHLEHVAHDDFERELDLALQLANRPSQHANPWEFRPKQKEVASVLHFDAPPMARIRGEYLRPLDVQPYRDGDMTKSYPIDAWIAYAKELVADLIQSLLQ